MKPDYEINPSAIMANAPVLLRQLLLIMSGAAAVVGFASARDLGGLWTYMHTDDFATVFAAAVGLGTIAWGQWKAHADKVRLVDISRAAPDSKAVVLEPTPPPSVD